MQAPKMHVGELDITAGLAAALIAEQFPHWSHLPLRSVDSAGTVHALYRLGDELLVRLPRLADGGTSGPGPDLMRRLALRLPVRLPSTIAEGRPTADYPCRWSVTRRLDGENPVEGHLAEPGLLAADLAQFLKALWKIDLPGGPPAYRGGRLTTLDEFTVRTIGHLHGVIDTSSVRSIWDHAVDLPSWGGPDTWIHADLMPGNVLTRNGRLAAVIDFECAGLGDPSQDLILAWMLLPATARDSFRRATGADDATWLRGRARALSIALGHVDYYRDTNPVMADNARYTIGEVLADYQSSGR